MFGLRNNLFVAAAMVGVTIAAIGCVDDGPQPSAEGRKYLLDKEPRESLSVTEMKEAVAAGAIEGEIAVVARVGGGNNETWDNAHASFLASDLSLDLQAADSHGSSHDDNCKFCQEKQQKQLDSMALIQIADPNGQVVPVDARVLLGLQKNQVVVAKGQAELNELGHVVFSATGIYVRKER